MMKRFLNSIQNIKTEQQEIFIQIKEWLNIGLMRGTKIKIK